jgi:uncharacterized membrane protein HdeD (DUF308 family)
MLRLDACQRSFEARRSCYGRNELVPERAISEAAMTATTETLDSRMTTSALAHRWGWLLVLSIVQIISGWIAIAIPVVASFAAVTIFGAVLIASAIFQLIHAFKVRSLPRSAWLGISGVLYGIAGIFVTINPVGGALALAVMIAILFIADGALRAAVAMTIRPLTGWGWLIAGGVGSIVVGVIFLIGWPATALRVIGLLLGINLVFTGTMHIAVALASRPR